MPAAVMKIEHQFCIMQGSSGALEGRDSRWSQQGRLLLLQMVLLRVSLVMLLYVQTAAVAVLKRGMLPADMPDKSSEGLVDGLQAANRQD